MRRLEQLTYAIIGMSFLMAIMFYPFLPEMIASHWDQFDNPDRFVSKMSGLFVIPIASLLFVFVFRNIPNLDPHEESIKKLRIYYDEFLFVLTAFFFYIHFVMIIWNSGIRFHILQLITPAFGLLIFYFGTLLAITKRNHIIGIATPWSIHDEKNWKKTHMFAGTVFKTAGILTGVGFLFPSLSLYFIIVPLIMAIVYTYIYSYSEYKEGRATSKNLRKKSH